MNGKGLIRLVREGLSESGTSDWMSEQLTYDYLYEAAIELAQRTRCITAEQQITTVATTQEYDLNGDFLWLYMRNRDQDYFVKYLRGTDYTFPLYKDYAYLYYDNTTTAQDKPQRFSLHDSPDMQSAVTGTATANGAATGNQSVLTDAASNFSNVWPGDVVENTTDGSDGIVLTKTSNTVLIVALFNGTNADWTIGDAYIVTPGLRYQVVLDPPPSVSGDVVYVPYVQRPAPVYHDYGVYRLPSYANRHIVDYAIARYKYRDREADFADKFLQQWEMRILRDAGMVNRTVNRNTLKVSFKKGVF